MFSNLKQKLQTREGLMLVGSVALVFAMFALLGLGSYAFARADQTNDEYSTISVTGNGESFVTPDVAKFTFTVQKDAKTMNEAEKLATADANALVEKLKAAGILEKDIKTEGFNAFPKYETKSAAIAPCGPNYCPPYNPGNPVIVGYTVSHTYSVKVRDLDKAGDIAQLITGANPYSVNGPDFTIDDEDAVTNDARGKAIADARAQARVLARQLGVHLGKIVDFQVVGNGPVYPMYAKSAIMSEAADAAGAPAPTIEPGQTDVKVQVQITYRIR